MRVRVVGEGGSSGAGRGLSGLTGQLVLVWGAWALARRCGDLRMVEAFHTGLWGLGLILQAGGGDSKIRFNLNERGPASEWALLMRDELCPWNLAVPEMERDSCPWRLSSAPACPGAPAVLSAHCSAVTGQPLSSLAHLGPRRTVLPPASWVLSTVCRTWIWEGILSSPPCMLARECTLCTLSLCRPFT